MILFVAAVLAFILIFPLVALLRRKWKRRSVTLSKPPESPDELINKLVHFFDAYSKIHEAYLAQAYSPEKYQDPYYIIGLVSEENVGEAVKMLSPIVRDAVPPNRKVEFQAIGRDRVSKYLLKEITPFYLHEESDKLSG